MTSATQSLWTINELGTQVAQALASDYDGSRNGRVRDVPDLRTIRYYTTLGLLDRPTQMRGRTALYGRRHLLQLVAIKRLQAQGLPLADVQTRLLGLTDPALAHIAQLPAATRPVETPPPAPRSFWKDEPAAFVSVDIAPPTETAQTVAPPGRAGDVSPPVAPSQTAQTVIPAALLPLAGGVSLLLQAVRPLDNDDIQALRAAAAPLLKLLEQRRLQ